MPGYRAGFGHIAARLAEQVADLGHGAVAIVRDDVEHHGHPMWRIAFVSDLLKLLRITVFARSASNGALDVLLGHVFSLGAIHRQA